MTVSDRALVLFLVVPQAVALIAFALGASLGWFVNLPVLVLGLLIAVIAQLPGGTPDSTITSGPRWPWPLLVFVGLYFLLKFDLSHYHLLGVNGPANHALGIGIGVNSADPIVNRVLGLAPVVPEGQVMLATAAQALAGSLGARLLFAWVFVGLALVGWRLTLHVLPERPRLALLVGALCALNPAFMEAWGLDSLGNALPALALGLTLLLIAVRAPSGTIGLAAGLAVILRPTFSLGVIPLLGLLVSRANDVDRRLRLVLGALLPVGVLVLWRIASGTPLALDPGLTPLGTGELAISDAIWWWDPMVRAPWSDGPVWAVGIAGALGRLGTIGAVILLVGLGRVRIAGRLLSSFAIAVLPVLLLVLMRGPAMSGEQHDRLFLFVVPGAVALALGLDRVRDAWQAGGRARIGWVVGVLLASTALVAAGNALREAPFPVEHRAHRSFERLLPQTDEAARPEPMGPLWWFPGYTAMHLLDPLVDQAGQRWRDLAWHVTHPRLRQRPMSIDERALARTKGDSFRSRWLPNHPLAELPVQPGDGPDPYGEASPLLIAIDLGAALTEGRVTLEVVATGTPEIDLATDGGPHQLRGVRLGADQPAVDVTLWKEYRSAHDAETAVVVMPRWDLLDRPGGAARDGTLLVQVPSRGFLSVVVVLGERVDVTALIAALEWNVGLRPGGELEVFGPFRL